MVAASGVKRNEVKIVLIKKERGRDRTARLAVINSVFLPQSQSDFTIMKLYSPALRPGEWNWFASWKWKPIIRSEGGKIRSVYRLHFHRHPGHHVDTNESWVVQTKSSGPAGAGLLLQEREIRILEVLIPPLRGYGGAFKERKLRRFSTSKIGSKNRTMHWVVYWKINQVIDIFGFLCWYQII